MAIAFDASSSGITGGSTLTIAHTCASGSVLVFGFNFIGTTVASGPTYNGVSMILVSAQSEGGGSEYRLYYLSNPTTGANNIVTNFNDSGTSIAGAAVSYTGVFTSGQPEATAHSGTASSVTSYAQAITTLTNNAWAVMMVAGNTGVVTAGTGTTQRVTSSAAVLGNRVSFLDSGGGISPAQLYTLNENQSSSAVGAIIVSLGVTAIVTSQGNFLTFF